MSQKTQRDSDFRSAPTVKQKKQEEPKITGLSPDDDVGLPSEGTGKPGDPMK